MVTKTAWRGETRCAVLGGLLLALGACDGEAGQDGQRGLEGAPGSGEEGLPGDEGPRGPEGPAGPRGPRGDDGDRGEDGEAAMPDMQGVDGTAGQGLIEASALSAIGTSRAGVYDEGAAEIVAFHAKSSRLFVVNADAGVVQVLPLSASGMPGVGGEVLDADADTKSDSFAPDGVNSVAVGGDLVAVAVQAEGGEDNGHVAFYDANDLSYLGSVEVGVLPDAVTFSPDGQTLVAACEGEQLREDDEPVEGESTPGSVAVIDVSDGAPGSASVLDFDAFDAMEAELRNRGVRLSPDVHAGTGYFPPSNDLEPEYTAISPDGKTAFVTLQENNAFAVVDLSAPAIVDVLPIQLKSWSNFAAAGSLQNVPIAYADLPALTDVETAEGTQQIRYGGFSGMALHEVSGDAYTFWVHGDRGPQTDKLDGKRPHVTHCPSDGSACDPVSYVATVFEVVMELDDGEWTLLSGPSEVFPLTRDGGATPITGMPNDPALDAGETPVDLREQPAAHVNFPSGYDPYGGDMEGIVFDSAGDFWMVDEYRAAIYYFNGENGQLIQRFVPAGTSAASSTPGTDFGLEVLPAAYLNRRANRGFEAVAYDPSVGSEGTIYAFIQSPMDNPDSEGRGDRRAVRVLAFDVAVQQPTAEYLYFLEGASHRSGGAVDKIGDAVYDPARDVFYVIERDGETGDRHSKKFLFEVSLKGATDILGDLAPGGLTFEQNSIQQLSDAGYRGVNKVKLANLASLGAYLDDKFEGLALVDADGTPTLAFVNDNDYGLGGAPAGDGTLMLEPDYKDEVFGFLPLTKQGFDASDEDGMVRIADWPVLGMPMPDSIASYASGDDTYYVTANEGDSRDYDEARGDDFSLEGPLFDAYETALSDAGQGNLLDDENLGRLQCSVIDGDLDLNGSHEQLHCYGARSFSIYDAYGSQVFDSADMLEQLVAYVAPADFNSDNGENGSFDSRSDAKGPEPEGIALGEIAGRTFAFIGLERQSAIVVADITDPSRVLAVDYVSHRNFIGDAEAGYAGDLGPEGLLFIDAEDSPTGGPLLVVGNEVSGSTTVYRVNL